MKTYLINLDRSADRLKFFTRQAEELQIEFERIPAVDGRCLSQSERESVLSPRFEFQPINAGEIGLFMSHKRAWQNLLDSGEPHATVFEDDVVMSSSMKTVMRSIDREIQEFDVIKLETTFRKVVCRRDGQSLTSGNNLLRLLSWHGGTAGYVISASCARRLLLLKQKLSDPIDQVMFNPMSQISAQLQLLQLSPAVCVQKDILEKADSAVFGTTIDRHVTGGRLFRHGPLIDFRRMVRKQMERQRRLWLTLNRDNCQTVIPFENREIQHRAA
jgi:glycosyl transferase family 25